MIYVWRCQSCGEEVSLERPMVEIDRGPEKACHCGEHNYNRVIRSANFHLKEGIIPWHNEAYSGTRRVMTSDRKRERIFKPGEQFSSKEDHDGVMAERKAKRKREGNE